MASAGEGHCSQWQQDSETQSDLTAFHLVESERTPFALVVGTQFAVPGNLERKHFAAQGIPSFVLAEAKSWMASAAAVEWEGVRQHSVER